MSRYAIGDIHGQSKALRKLLYNIGFDNNKDQLVCLGDIFDYNDGVCDVIEQLLQIKNLTPILGNHDAVFKIWLNSGKHLYNWSNGGRETLASYSKFLGCGFNFTDNMIDPQNIPKHHREFINRMVDYHITDDDILFCHAGFDTNFKFDEQYADEFYNNRSMFKQARKGELDLSQHSNFKRIFIGHSITGDGKPFISDRLINLDTGAKKQGNNLTIMDIDTLEYWQVTT